MRSSSTCQSDFYTIHLLESFVHSRGRFLTTVMILLGGVTAALAGPTPQVGNLLPRGGQRGTELQVHFAGNRLDKAQEVFFYDTGITAGELEQVDAKNVKVTFTIAPDCRLGLHRIRLRTADSLSNDKFFSVGALPQIDETEPNSDRNKPQQLTPPITVNGRITPEDVDWFAVTAKANETLAIEVEGMRLGDVLFDPFVAVYDAAGNELAVVDESPLLKQDACAVVTFPADGMYTIELRETAYGGSNQAWYRLHVGAFPRPVAALPTGGTAGTAIDVQWIGDTTIATQKVALPDLAADFLDVFPQRGDQLSPSPVPFRVVNHPVIAEIEPNNNHEQATPIQLPCGVSGVIDGERDVDFFAFDAKKGQVFDVRVHARALGSPLDPVINARIFKGKNIVGNDDSGGPDSKIRFRAPEDSKYVFQLRDLLYRSSPSHTYFLEALPVQPALSLSMLPEEASVNVAAGNRAVILVTAKRSDFDGPLSFTTKPLPAGVTLHAATLAEGVTQLPVVFEAVADAKPAGAAVDLVARHTDESNPIEGRLQQTIKTTIFRSDIPIYTTEVDRLALAVTDPVPFRLTIVEPKVPLVQGGSMALPIRLERDEGFTAPVDVGMVWNPPGVGTGTARFTGDTLATNIYLNANGNARVGEWKIALRATAKVAGGTIETSSQLATLRIAEPYVTFAIAQARTDQGKPVNVEAKMTTQQPFEGEAKVTLHGLPAHVATSQPATVTAATEALTYPLTVGEKAPPGRHGNVFVQAIIMQDGEPIVHNSARGQLIIDKPLPPIDPAELERRAEAKRKAQEEKERRKAARIAAAAKRRAEREAKRRVAAQAITAEEKP